MSLKSFGDIVNYFFALQIWELFSTKQRTKVKIFSQGSVKGLPGGYSSASSAINIQDPRMNRRASFVEA